MRTLSFKFFSIAVAGIRVQPRPRHLLLLASSQAAVPRRRFGLLTPQPHHYQHLLQNYQMNQNYNPPQPTPSKPYKKRNQTSQKFSRP